MKLQKKFSTLFISALLTFVLVLSGCAKTETATTEEVTAEETTTKETTEETTEEVTEENVTYPLTLSHAFGETIIESKPERVATIAWGNHDLPLALGIVPVGISSANYGVVDGSGMLPWTAEKFKELGVDSPVLFDDVAGLNYEAISDVQPDVILAAYSGVTQEEYDLLSEIAPVVVYTTSPWQTLWRDQILINAEGIGMLTEGQALVADLESLIAEKTASYPKLQGKSAAFFYFNPTDLGKFYIYLPSDPRVAYLSDLGMTVPKSVQELALESTSFAIEISAENADILSDIDIIVAYGNQELLMALQADPLLSTVPAISRGSVALIEDGTPLAASGTPSALSIPAVIDEYLAIMGAAADKVQ